VAAWTGDEDRGAARLPAVLATLRSFAARAGATRVTLLYDQGGDLPPALVDCPNTGPVVVGEGEEQRAIADPDALGGRALGEPHVHALPPFDVDAAEGRITAPLGALESHGRAVRDLGALFGGRSAVSVEWPTTDPEAPLTLASRAGEPMVAALGDAQFDLPDGWPQG